MKEPMKKHETSELDNNKVKSDTVDSVSVSHNYTLQAIPQKQN